MQKVLCGFCGVIPISVWLLILSSIAAGQSCPQTVEGFQLVKSTYSTWTVNNLSCKPRDEGGTMCWIVCGYSEPATRGGFFVQAMWYTQASPRGPYYSEMCKPNARENTITNATKQVQAFWGDAAGGDEYGAARWVAQQLFNIGDQQAVPCPARPGVGPGPSAACMNNLNQLNKNLARSAEITAQLANLENYKAKETGYRDNLSYFNKLIAALNTQNYSGELRTTVAGLRDNRSQREEFARPLGLDPNLDALNLVRNARDLTIAKIEYLVDAPVFIKRLSDERVLMEFETAKLRASLAQGGCPGTFGANACDLTGRWTFDIGGNKEFWTFAPRQAGRYSASKIYSDGPSRYVTAEAEVFDRQVVLRFKEGEGFIGGIAGSYKFDLDASCAYGTGTSHLTKKNGDEAFTARRDRSFIANKLYEIEYMGKTYSAVYERSVHTDGRPMDLFYFKIVLPNGIHVRQDGAELWGRFVRFPSLDHPDQPTVMTWFVNWNFDGSRWVSETRSGVVFLVK